MSLLYFHVALISIAALFAVYFGFWELAAYADSNAQVDWWTGMAFLVIAAATAVYLFWFIRKKMPAMKKG